MLDLGTVDFSQFDASKGEKCDHSSAQLRRARKFRIIFVRVFFERREITNES